MIHSFMQPSASKSARKTHSPACTRIPLLPFGLSAPAWARGDASSGASPPRDPADYVASLRALVARYGPAGSFWSENPSVPRRPLRTWQIWNEPQLRYQWADQDWQ